MRITTGAHYQSVRVASRQAFYDGVYYGGIAGFFSAVYYRKMRMVPIYALGAGFGFAALMGSSAWFRMDL